MSVLIAGAGPAGSRLAEQLSLKGVSVTLVDQLKTPRKNCFSSAVIPINAIDECRIPLESISTYWNTWQIFDPYGKSHQWENECDLGVVLDFGKFREILWDKAVHSGVDLLNGWIVKSVISLEKHVEVFLQGPNGQIEQRKVLFVVDATGHNRSIIGFSHRESSFGKDKLLTGSGIEWLVQGDYKSAKNWKNRVTFFLGSNWISHGYGWVFPMSNNQLKIGVCSLPPPSKYLKHFQANKNGLKRLILKLDLGALPVVERHGGIISSTIKRKELHHIDRIIGVGDAVSTANLLGGEGIRHALLSADVLAPLLVKACQLGNSCKQGYLKPILRYEGLLRNRLGWRWNISNRIGKKTWWGLSGDHADTRLLNLINGLSARASAEDISALLFHYRFERYGLKLLPYLLGWR